MWTFPSFFAMLDLCEMLPVKDFLHELSTLLFAGLPCGYIMYISSVRRIFYRAEFRHSVAVLALHLCQNAPGRIRLIRTKAGEEIIENRFAVKS